MLLNAILFLFLWLLIELKLNSRLSINLKKGAVKIGAT